MPLLALLALTLLAMAPLTAGDLGDGGQVITVSGQVSIERQHGELWAVQTSNIIQPGQIIVTGADGYALLRLADGSNFEVFGNSRVVFRANRGNWRDLLDIYLGKVKIHIEKLGGRPNPYRVNSATALIAVRGTVFEVTVASDESTTVAVEEGLVSVIHKLLPSKEVYLSPGETLLVRPGEPLTPATVSKARIAVQVIRTTVDQALQAVRIGSPTRGGPTSTPTGGVPAGGGTGDMGQPPPPQPPSNGGNGDDVGSGSGTPTVTLPPATTTPPVTTTPNPGATTKPTPTPAPPRTPAPRPSSKRR